MGCPPPPAWPPVASRGPPRPGWICPGEPLETLGCCGTLCGSPTSSGSQVFCNKVHQHPPHNSEKNSPPPPSHPYYCPWTQKHPAQGLALGTKRWVIHSLPLSYLQLCCGAQDRAFLQGRESAGTSPGRGRLVGQADCRVLPWLRPLCHQLDQTGQHLFCVCGTKVNILDVASGAVLQSLEQVRAGRAGVRDWCGKAAYSHGTLCAPSHR